MTALALTSHMPKVAGMRRVMSKFLRSKRTQTVLRRVILPDLKTELRPEQRIDGCDRDRNGSRAQGAAGDESENDLNSSFE